jgi:alpha-tubulin suppressor-like RCC1 family protein
VDCWGYNYYGQLGNDSTTNSSIPVEVQDLGGTPVKIVAGGEHTCVLLSSGQIQCWGYNGYGQLGNGGTSNSLVPVYVEDLATTAVDVSAGFDFTCAVLSNGGVQCWGYNSYGELGDDSTTSSSYPVYAISSGEGVTSVSAGYDSACALFGSGEVECWGYNYYGQLGNDSTTTSYVPVEVYGLGSGSGTTMISSGGIHVCALVSGYIKCWGDNSYGQLGVGNTTSSSIPVSVNLSGVTSVRAGGYNTGAILTSGYTYIWGDDSYGEIGNGTTSSSPVTTPELSSASSLTALTGSPGYFDMCGITSSKTVLCWGYNAYGELGDDSTTNSDEPVTVYDLTVY